MSHTFRPQEFKRLFPLFSNKENQGLVYLDNAATSQRPACVIQAVTDFYSLSNANTHRSSHRLARAATAMVERTRNASADFLGASEPAEIVFSRGTTEALNFLANSLCSNLDPGDEILLSCAEHHANLVPWQMAAERYQLKLKFLPELLIPGPCGIPQTENFHEHLSDKTKVVSLTAGSNALGFSVDVASVAAQLENLPCCLVVDGAQLAAHQRVDVKLLGCDFFVCSAHKFYGPTGIGLLYGRRELLELLPPWQGGGEMISSVSLNASEWASIPHRFEAGTASLSSIAGLEAALKFLSECDRQAMYDHEQELIQYLHSELFKIEEIELLSRPEGNLGIATFVPRGDVSAIDLGHGLDEQDIALRVGHHCAQPLIDALGKGPTIRASVLAYNTRADIDALVVGLKLALGAVASAVPKAGNELATLSIEDLRAHNDWQARYRQLLKWGSAIQSKPMIRTDLNRVNGCEADTWLQRERRGEHYLFSIDSDSRVVRGLGALLLVLIQNKTEKELEHLDIEGVFNSLGLKQHLSPSRSNGFYAMVEKALKF